MPSYIPPVDDNIRKYNEFVKAFTTSENSHNSKILVKQFLTIERDILPECDYAITDTRGYTPLMIVAECIGSDFTNDDLISILTGGNVNLYNHNGQTALMLATRFSGSEDAVKTLLDEGANPDLQGMGGKTALMYATQYSTDETIRILIEAGANVTLRDWEGHTALDFAKTSIAKKLLYTDTFGTNVLTTIYPERYVDGDYVVVCLLHIHDGGYEVVDEDVMIQYDEEDDVKQIIFALKGETAVDTSDDSVLTTISMNEWEEGTIFRVILMSSEGVKDELATIYVGGDERKIMLTMQKIYD